MQGIAFKLPYECSIFQCEFFSIFKACYFIKTLETENKSICICSDSQGVLRALCSTEIKSNVVLECVKILNVALIMLSQLTNYNSIQRVMLSSAFKVHFYQIIFVKHWVNSLEAIALSTKHWLSDIRFISQ
uniref:Uncharacterized protein n=1 Tax=Megaselia scalaris TaxID=36166 RepID=T1GA66_MEGSC